jgi:flavin reductase (DIM6/NTAB) family NADH-FMN oxidoreductase RutF
MSSAEKNRWPAAAAAVAPLPGGVDRQEFRRVMSRFATGVAVVTTLDAAAAPVGLTINSFSSVSLDPPLVLWSIDLRASSLEAFRNSGSFAINILPRSAEALCRRFAERLPDRFAGMPYASGRRGQPLLPGMLGQVCCRTWSRYPAGDHEIFVGEVEEIVAGDGDPLVFYRGRFTSLHEELS